MRHGKKFNHLSRKAAHRDALLSNMTNSLIEHKRISTTVAKAKALRKYVEPIITKAKNDSTHNRRSVFSQLQSKEAVQTLFNDISPKIGQRPGGYTRIIKLGKRLGDSADLCIIELVDFNELLLEDEKPKKSSRRSRRSKKKDTTTTATATEDKETPAKASTTKEAKTEETTEEKKSEEAKTPKAATKTKASDDKTTEKKDKPKAQSDDDKSEEKKKDE